MDQPTFADLEYQGKTRREVFLERMDGLIKDRRASPEGGSASA